MPHFRIGMTVNARIRPTVNDKMTNTQVIIVGIKPVGEFKQPLYMYETDQFVGFGVEPSTVFTNENGDLIQLVSDYYRDKGKIPLTADEYLKHVGFTGFAGT